MKHYYILLETDDASSSFISNVKTYDENNNPIISKKYYEIYFLPQVEDIKVLKISNKQIIVQENNQSDAFKSFKKIYPDLYKRSYKDFYEKELCIQM